MRCLHRKMTSPRRFKRRYRKYHQPVIHRNSSSKSVRHRRGSTGAPIRRNFGTDAVKNRRAADRSVTAAAAPATPVRTERLPPFQYHGCEESTPAEKHRLPSAPRTFPPRLTPAESKTGSAGKTYYRRSTGEPFEPGRRRRGGHEQSEKQRLAEHDQSVFIKNRRVLSVYPVVNDGSTSRSAGAIEAAKAAMKDRIPPTEPVLL